MSHLWFHEGISVYCDYSCITLRSMNHIISVDSSYIYLHSSYIYLIVFMWLHNYQIHHIYIQLHLTLFWSVPYFLFVDVKHGHQCGKQLGILFHFCKMHSVYLCIPSFTDQPKVVYGLWTLQNADFWVFMWFLGFFWLQISNEWYKITVCIAENDYDV